MPFALILGHHEPTRPLFRRTCIRGVLPGPGGSVLLVTTRVWQTLALPGGGQERGETDEDTLVREMMEETGFLVRRGSLRLFGQVDMYKPDRDVAGADYHQCTRYYFCETTGRGGARLSRSEERDGLRTVFLPPEEALAVNEGVRDPNYFWLCRENAVLRRLTKG